MNKQAVYIPRLLPKKEGFLSGHRACIGCGEALAVRLACKALGGNVIIANATGCMEVVSSQIPYTSWGVPWIHTLCENSAAVASGVEAMADVDMSLYFGSKYWTENSDEAVLYCGAVNREG